MITTIRGTTKKPISSQRLAAFFLSNPDLEGALYLGYPIIGTPEGGYPIDALWVSPQKGIVLFNLVEGRSVEGYEELQDDSANKLEAKLRNHRALMKGRSLLVSISTITFAPIAATADLRDDEYILANEETLRDSLDSIATGPQAYEEAVAVIQSISTIRKGKKKRSIANVDSRGSKLKSLEDSIANLDNLQGRAVIETVEGVQRIRGLAGSGKTIVLALKAAYLHAQHPEWKIGVTFHTRALKAQFRRLINTFYIEQTNEEPDWENLEILQSWGAPGSNERNGIYYSFCKQAEVEYFDLQGARNRFPSGVEFEKACEKALKDAGDRNITPLYDAILVDEAQDLSPAFLLICYQLLSDKKRLVYAYDELQNLGNRSLPPPEEIFGLKLDGTPMVSFTDEDGKPQQDIILEKCYRNSRPLLATAHALGFGIYRTPPMGETAGLIQMFDQSSLWLDVGYEVVDGKLEDGHSVALARPQSSSPLFLEDHSSIDDLIQFHSFDSFEAQNEWLAENIQINLQQDELQPDDIIVINPDPLTTKSVVGPVRKLLFQRSIKTHLAGVDTSPDIFFVENGDSVAFTGIYRAKGNEAGMVYIINAQDCFSSAGGLAKVRSQLFTAITRSKAWVRVLGFGPRMQKLEQEFNRVKEHGFELKFRYPTSEERKHLNIINREKDDKLIKDGQQNLGKLLNDFKSGRVFIEDLPGEQIDLLRELLREKK